MERHEGLRPVRVGGLLLLAAACARAAPAGARTPVEPAAPDPRSIEPAKTDGRPPAPGDQAAERLRAATVALIRGRRAYCAGALVERGDLVATSAHCFRDDLRIGRLVTVELSDGSRVQAILSSVDRQSDAAVLRLRSAASLPPLPLADSDAVAPGETVFFLGRPLPGRAVQRARVVKRDVCGDLASVPDGIHATYHGVKGDSGAPLVTRDGVVGLVHGGARCRIAVPSRYIVSLVEEARSARSEP